MVIKLTSNKKKRTVPAPQLPPENRFTLKDIEELFKVDNWKEFYEKNETKFWANNLDIYSWCIYPCIQKDDMFYRCVLHPQVEVQIGPDKPPLLVFYKNIYYAEMISHCIFYKPEEHKKYIIEKLKL